MKTNFIKEILENTSINSEGEAFWYEKFIWAASITDGIVMDGEVRWEICNLISKAEGREHNESIEKSKEIYKNLLGNFKKKNLITEVLLGNGLIYPKIIGYNFLNDPRIYVPQKSKKEEKWTGRFPISLINQYELARFEHYGYEIKDKSLMGILLN